MSVDTVTAAATATVASQCTLSGDEVTESDQSERPGRSLAGRLLLTLIHLYQAARAGRPSPCRYLPTCSVYGIEAIERHGAWRGGWLTVRRIGRCHPWGGHGADPVPELRKPS